MTDRALPRPLTVAIAFVLGSALFAAAYCQAPLYYSNQNQYFLHGLAAAGTGLLREDWLANTADPTPVFSGLVAVTARLLPPWVFHVYHALLLGIYATAMLGLFVFVVGPDLAWRRWPVFLALFLAIHAAILRWLSYRVAGLDYPWYFQAGVAGQYVLGCMLQPSVFGVLLIAAIALFAHDRPYLAATAVGVAAICHSTYLMAGGLLMIGFLVVPLRAGQVGRAALMGSLALVLVLPVLGYVLGQFRPTSPETFTAAQDILVNTRIPHHARPDLWFDWIAGVQIGLIVLGFVLVRGTSLPLALGVAFALAALLTLAQVFTGNATLALLFPWRLSAVLVPVATTIVLSRLVGLSRLPFDGTAARFVAGVVAVLLVAGGVTISAQGLAFRGAEEEMPVMDFVRATRQPGDVYLLPVRVPDLSKQRGSLSGDFKPAAARRTDVRIVPLDMQRFRLHAGAPIYVDFKAIPYKDRDVIEWRARLDRAQRWQQGLRDGRLAEMLPEMREHGVTHWIEPVGPPRQEPGVRLVHEDVNYRVYRLDSSDKK